MKIKIYIAALFCAMFGVWSHAENVEQKPTVGKLETITYTFKDSPVQFPKNYVITLTAKSATIDIEYYTDNKLKSYSESKEMTASDWKKCREMTGNVQEPKNYEAIGDGYKTSSLTIKNTGTLEAYRLSWTSLSSDEISKNTHKLLQKIHQLVPSYDEVLAKQAKKEETHLLGGIEIFTLISKTPYPSPAKNFEIKITKTGSTVRYQGQNHEESLIEKKITEANWNELVNLAGKLQEAGNYPAPNGATGYQSFTLIKKNGGTIESYELNWTGMSDDKIDENTKKLIAKIRGLVPSYDEVLAKQAKKEETQLLGEIEIFTLISKTPYPSPAKNFEIKITKTGSTVRYQGQNHEESLIEKKITEANWNELVNLAGKLQEAGNYPAPNGATGYQSFTLIKKNGGTIESYELNWTGMSDDKIDENTKKLIAKIRGLVDSYQGQ